jgi:hypothetical protein
VNQVCDWLESMGYTSGNDQDMAFDNVIVTLGGDTNASGPAILFADAMETAPTAGPPRASGIWPATSAPARRTPGLTITASITTPARATSPPDVAVDQPQQRGRGGALVPELV